MTVFQWSKARTIAKTANPNVLAEAPLAGSGAAVVVTAAAAIFVTSTCRSPTPAALAWAFTLDAIVALGVSVILFTAEAAVLPAGNVMV